MAAYDRLRRRRWSRGRHCDRWPNGDGAVKVAFEGRGGLWLRESPTGLEPSRDGNANVERNETTDTTGMEGGVGVDERR